MMMMMVIAVITRTFNIEIKVAVIWATNVCITTTIIIIINITDFYITMTIVASITNEANNTSIVIVIAITIITLLSIFIINHEMSLVAPAISALHMCVCVFST